MKPPDNAEGPSPCQDSTLNSAPINANAANNVQARALNFERNRVPSAFASQFAPDGSGRTCWWIAYRCPWCEASHLGRSPYQIETGIRRSRCGRRVWLVIARTYRGRFEVSA